MCAARRIAASSDSAFTIRRSSRNAVSSRNPPARLRTGQLARQKSEGRRPRPPVADTVKRGLDFGDEIWRMDDGDAGRLAARAIDFEAAIEIERHAAVALGERQTLAFEDAKTGT